MNEIGRTGSRLPSHPEYWEGLARTIEAGAEPYFRDRSVGRSIAVRASQVWWARRAIAPALAATAIIAALGAWWWMPAKPANAAPSAIVALALQPGDPLAGLLLDPSAPPITDLLPLEGRAPAPEEN